MVSFVIEPIVIFVNISLFNTIFKLNNTNTLLNYSLSQIIWYFAAINFVWIFIWNMTDDRISKGILSGDIAMYLIQPIPILKRELANTLADRFCAIIFEFIPCLIIYSFIYFPDFMTVYSLIRFLFLVMFSFIMLFLINFLIGLASFFIKSNISLQALKGIIISFAAGALIPFEFFPEWLQNFLLSLPFQYLFYWPVQFFLNKEITQNIFFFMKIISIQIIWITILYICTVILWKISVKRFCSVGG
jgi:ABC-2 type transport system permease protein